MSIDVKDLPPAYQAQALRKLMERKLMERERRKQRAPLPSPADAPTGGGRKYHNKPTERVTPAGNVLRFDSQKEARRYDELATLERAGKIRDLRLQMDFTLQEAYTDGEGRRVRAIRYRADFTYQKPSFVDRDGETCWALVVEDVKSKATKTKQYAMKRKMMQEHFGIYIQEV